MKILIVNWQDVSNPLAGGAEVNLHETYSRIAAMGHDVTLFCSSYTGALPIEEMKGIHVIREGGRNLFNYVVLKRYYTTFRKQHFDVIIDDINKIPFFLSSYVREPVVGIVHHLFGKSIFEETNPVFASYVYGAEQLMLKTYRALPMIAVSPSTYQELLSSGFAKEKTRIIYNGIDHNVFRVKNIPKSATPLIGVLGRLKRYKSFDHLIEAFPAVQKVIPEATLVVVGDGDDKQRLISLATSLGIQNSIVFTGFVAEEEKVDWLNRMHVAVNTSAKEGWGLTALEANACGTPTVSSNVQGLRDAVIDGETGLLYDYGNTEQLAEKLILVLQDNVLRSRLTDNALRRSKEFDWQIGAEKSLEIIERAVAKRKMK